MADSSQRELDRFFAEIRASAHLSDVELPRKKGQHKHKLVAKAENLFAHQVDLLVELLEGDAALLTVDGEPYAYWGTGHMQALAPNATKHEVTKSSCTCKGHTLGGSECKHMKALRRFLACP